jgi:ABC-type multidrug transport system fused ATPase/permease subunit
VLSLMVAIVAVRAFGLGKGVLRYAERLVSHDAALRALSDLRVQIWTALVRLGPAVTARLRRGDLLSRLVGDVDEQQDVLVRVALPAACAATVGTAVTVGLGLLLPAAGAIVAAGLLLAGVGAPAVAVLAARATERRTAALRGEVVVWTEGTGDGMQVGICLGAFRGTQSEPELVSLARRIRLGPNRVAHKPSNLVRHPARVVPAHLELAGLGSVPIPGVARPAVPDLEARPFGTRPFLPGATQPAVVPFPPPTATQTPKISEAGT